MKNNNIITLGDDWYRWPREFWGTKDWERYRASQARLPAGTEIPPVPLHTPVSIGLHGDAEAERNRRRREADRILEQHGLRPRRRVW